MKKTFLILSLGILLIGCKKTGSTEQERILKQSVGRTNTILTVIKGSLWDGRVGDEIRTIFGEHQIGLPQPETLMSMTQVDPSGFTNVMNGNKAVMIVQKGENEGIKVVHDKYAKPQIIVYVTAKDEFDLIDLIEEKGKDIIQTFKDEDVKFTLNNFKRNKINEGQFKTIKDLNISLTIPKNYKLVKDSIGFLWLRQHLKSGIARGAGSNNILIYSVPLDKETNVADNIALVRDKIGKQHIPGSQEGMYMITEKAYTPHIFETKIDGKKAYETRGKWEVKNDFMAGPFINFTIPVPSQNRTIVFEGFTYAPSVNKRDFLFELEAIGRSLKLNKEITN